MKQGHVWVGVGISLALLGYLFSKVEYRQLWRSLASANVPLLLIAAVVISGTLVMRAWRWQYLLKPVKPVRFSNSMAATAIGMMANMILPVRLGEIVRAVVLGHRERVEKSAAFATVVVDRLLDGFTILFILALILLIAPLPVDQAWQRRLQWGGVAFFLLYFAVFALLFYLYRSPARVLQSVRRLCSGLPVRWVDRLCRFLESFSGGLQILDRTEYLAQISVTSLVLWGLVGVYNFIIVLAFQLDLPWAVGFILVVAQAAAVMIPSSPGFVGTHHAASVACLSLWGISPEAALSVALVMHAIGYFLTIAIGAVYLWTVGLSMRDIGQLERAIPGTPSTTA
ncbi:MAG TPA: lysylphosphatidylglycerol synthase transmembrane domain-containing protein [Candidatus Tectomicrobia bacterium]